MVLLLSSALRLSAAEKTMMMQSFSEAQQKDKTSKYRSLSIFFSVIKILNKNVRDNLGEDQLKVN